MSTFIVATYETYASSYRVEADSEAEAIAKVLDGDGEQLEDGLNFVESNEDVGLSVDEFPELVKELSNLGVQCGDVIPSIASVTKLR